MKSPKAPKPTAEETAMTARQTRALDEETADMEKRLKAVTRGTLGTKSLLKKGSGKSVKSAKKAPSMMGYGGMNFSINQRAMNTQLRK